MNAGCYGNYIGDFVQSIEGVDKAGNFSRISRENIQFEYRTSNLPKNFIVTSAVVRPEKMKKADNRKENGKDVVEKRSDTTH